MHIPCSRCGRMQPLMAVCALFASMLLASMIACAEPACAAEPGSALSVSTESRLTLGDGDALDATDSALGKNAVHATPKGTQLVSWRRYAGSNALGTMERIVNAGWKKSDTVVIATSGGYWDAICANSLAGLTKAPMLITNGKALSEETRKAISRLGATTAYICGGTAAISASVESQVKAQLAGEAHVVRLAGRNAVGTSVAIAKHVASQKKGSTCIIATDSGYWDALAASPYSYASNTPILLARDGKQLKPEAVAAIQSCGFTHAVVAGGTAAVSSEVEAQLKSLGLSCTRLAGAQAYETARRFAEWSIKRGMSVKNMGVATAQGYWDALTGAALCGKNNAVLTLADDKGHYDACSFATSQRRTMGSALVFGGAAAVGATTFYDLQAATLEKPITTYQVLFNANGGQGSMKAQAMPVGKRTALARNAFRRTGYDFVGWNTKANGRGTAYADRQEAVSLACAGNRVTLYAQWRVSASYLRSQLDLVEMYRSAFRHGPKPASVQKYIMLHDTEGEGSPESVVNWWSSSGAGVAAHFVVGRDGHIVQCVPLDEIAHHAGYGNTGHNAAYGVTDESRDDKVGTVAIGSWASDYGMNSYSVGIEIVHVGGGAPYTAAQLNALDDLIAYIDAYYGFESAIIDHKAWRSGNSDTSPEFAGYLANYQRYRHH